MNEQIPTSELKPVKPCRKCGEVDRYSSGRCKKCHKICLKSSYQKHKEKILAANRIWIIENKQRHIDLQKAWRDANRDSHRNMIKQWELNNPDKVKAKSLRSNNARRARLAGSSGKLSKGIVAKLLKLQKGKCAYCATVLHKHHLDHIIPLALGGKNTDDNVQLLCPPCNMSKGAKHPIDYMQSKGLLL